MYVEHRQLLFFGTIVWNEAGRVVDTPFFFEDAVVEAAFNQLVAEEGKYSSAKEDRTGVAVPVYARCTAAVVG